MLLDRLIPKELWERLLRRKGAARWLGLAGLAVLVFAIEWCETTAVRKVAHDAVTGCSETTESMTAKADRILSAVEERYGAPTRRLRNGDELWYERITVADRSFGRFEVRLNDSSSDACYWELEVAAHVTHAGSDAERLVQALDDYETRRIYERRGRFVAREDGSLWLIKSESLRTNSHLSFFWLEDHLDLAEHWGREWISEVRDGLGKDAGGRRESKWRPGRDPDSVIARARAFLRDAGVSD